MSFINVIVIAHFVHLEKWLHLLSQKFFIVKLSSHNKFKQFKTLIWLN